MRRITTLYPAIAVTVFAATSCTVGPDYVKPEIDLPEGYYSELSDPAAEATSLRKWWRKLQDPVLDSLIEQATAGNLDLRAADAQLRQARAQRVANGSVQFPTLGLTSSASRSGSSANASSGDQSNYYAAGFDAAWELDVFGGNARAIEAADADLSAQAESRRNTLVSVLAEVALNYVELRASQAQLISAEQNVVLQEETLKVVAAQHSAGKVNRMDVERAISNLQATRAELPLIRQSVNQMQNRLAILLGETPGSLTQLNDPAPIPQPDLTISVGVPADLLRRRPDIRAAERQLAAETARIGVATAELYPKFSLTGSIGLESLNYSSLVAGNSAMFGLGSSLTTPIFNGGRLRAQIEIQDARQEQAMVAYEQSILTALEDVENAITGLVEGQLRQASLAESVAALERATEIARLRYEAGAVNYISLLDAQRSLVSSQDSLIASEGAITSNLVRLYKALGGGWTGKE